MKADLNLALVKRLKLGERPVGVNSKGALVFEANVENKPYILWDSNRDAPPGFGVRLEQAILSRAPNVYNALKPIDWPPLPAPEPHVYAPPKPRSGRPPKASNATAD